MLDSNLLLGKKQYKEFSGKIIKGLGVGVEELFIELVRNLKEIEEAKEESFVSIVDTSDMGWETPLFSQKIDEWKSGNEPFIDSLVEDVIQQMSNQKIIAKLKEGSIMITPERIDYR